VSSSNDRVIAPDTHWPFLDLVRFVAALLVLFGHARGLFFESIHQVVRPSVLTMAFYLVTGVQHEAVILFFVVSGFLVGGSVWTLIEQGQFRARLYLLNRFVRIYLVFIPALALVAVIATAGADMLSDTRLYAERPLFPSGVNADWSWSQLPCHLAALQGLACAPWGVDPPLWSLGYEWGFYLLAPAAFAAWCLPKRWAARLLVVALLATTVVVLLPNYRDWQFWWGAWLLGAISLRVLVRGGVPVAAGLVGLALCGASLVISRAAVLPGPVTDIGVAIGLALALACPRIVSFNIAQRLVRRGAGLSYSLYVIHLPLVIFVGAILERSGWPKTLAPPGPQTYAAFACVVAAAIGAAYLFAKATEDNTAAVRGWLRAYLGL